MLISTPGLAMAAGLAVFSTAVSLSDLQSLVV
jgi:hypothetical protein